MKKILLETSFSKIYMIIMVIITLLILGGYFSYAMFTVTKEKENAISIVTGNLTYKLEVDGEESNKLVVDANSSKEFIVTLSNPNNRIARFNFYYLNNLPNNVKAGYIIDCETNSLPDAKGVNLEKEGSTGSSNIYKIMVENNSNSDIEIKLGVNVGLDYNDLELPSNGHLFKEYINTPNAPELDDNMIAVTYNGSNWVKADTNNKDNDWYNYDEQKWANAVTVSSSTRSTYKNANVGTVINMNDIETMWVCIPRYSYSIGSEDGTNYYGKQGEFLTTTPTQELPGEIDIKFVPTGEKDMCSAKYIVRENDVINSWYTPDAFTFGDKELSGIWVGKFETSSSNPSASNGGGNTTELEPMIKPNITSWRYINIANMYNVALKMNDAGNRYGFTSNIDSHMMKNSEWAAVSYLSQSKYGKLGNSNFSGANKEIYQNKSTSFITGCSWGHPSGGTESDYGCQYTYDVDINGTGASTTGNIYGIYDMSGGSNEHVMGNYNNTIAESGFNTMPESKYYDLYTPEDIDTLCNETNCLSHGLYETLNWYGDAFSVFSSNTYLSWVLRGGFYGYNRTDGETGIFYFTITPIYNGGPSNSQSYRIVISI